MVRPLAARKKSASRSLCSEGKLVTEIVVPNGDIAATALPVQTITKLSGCRVKSGNAPLCPVASPICQPWRLMGEVVTFFNSIHSLPGKPSWGAGSAMISSITTS